MRLILLGNFPRVQRELWNFRLESKIAWQNMVSFVGIELLLSNSSQVCVSESGEEKRIGNDWNCLLHMNSHKASTQVMHLNNSFLFSLLYCFGKSSKLLMVLSWLSCALTVKPQVLMGRSRMMAVTHCAFCSFSCHYNCVVISKQKKRVKFLNIKCQ